MCEELVPGSVPSYELAKQIYAYHPLGAVLVDAPITRAQARLREIAIPVLGEEQLIEQFQLIFDTLSRVGGTVVLHNLAKTARMYGIAALGVGEVGKDPAEPLDSAKIYDADLYFNVFDPLNTAGSLVLNQNPNAADFLKPGYVRVNGQVWHPSRLFVKMNEQPIYIEWTGSGFGFVGRSVFQRGLYPLKSFVQSMITDQLVVQKVGLIIYKADSPSSFLDNIIQGFMGLKRAVIKSGMTGNVASIGTNETIETINMQNLDKPFIAARTNIIKNIASACGMPASIILQESLVEGMGEGTEDFKKEVEYLEYIRQDLQPSYDFLDRIVMRKAWTPDFFAALSNRYPEYKKLSYEEALHQAMRAFSATWPNLMIEPESEKSKTADVKLKAVVATVEVLAPLLDPENTASLATWVADNVNEQHDLFSGKLSFDEDSLVAHLETNAAAALEPDEGEETKPRAFSAAS
jgi:Protein of unknown function (DUF1073)